MSSLPSTSRSGTAVRPPKHIGMQVLDRSAFQISVPIVSVAVDAAKVGQMRSHPDLRNYTVDLPKVKPIVSSDVPSETNVKLIRLKVESEDELPNETVQLVNCETRGFRKETIVLGYDNWSTSEILAAALPTAESDDIPSSFTSTGHIAHMNLRDEWLPYKNLIGQVILDKNPGLRTIVNKLETIHAQYRYFDMEVLAGDEDYITTVNESDCTFTFDFSKVYWNSRLHHEHERLISTFEPGDLVVDVMAGVGPFAVPAAKRGCYVLGNDLNPESVKWMRENRVTNKVEDTLRVSEVDGHEFIKIAAKQVWESPFTPALPKLSTRQQKEARRAREKQQSSSSTSTSAVFEAITKKDISSAAKEISSMISGPAPATTPQGQGEMGAKAPRTISHFIMNLPDSALTFLSSYNGCLKPLLSIQAFTDKYGLRGEKMSMPLVHTYCFTREIERDPAELDICKRASEYLQFDVSPTIQGYHLHHVRSVAPNKDMYCLSFNLPRQVAFRDLAGASSS